MSDPTETVVFGKHRVRCDGLLLLVQFIGDLSMEEVRQICDVGDQLAARHGVLYMLADVEQATAMPAEIRRVVVDWVKRGHVRGVANIKASLNLRGLSILLANAARILSGIPGELTFVANEAEGRAWVAGLERKRLQRER